MRVLFLDISRLNLRTMERIARAHVHVCCIGHQDRRARAKSTYAYALYRAWIMLTFSIC